MDRARAQAPAGRKIVRQQIETVALSEDLSFAIADPIRVD
jgi:hypothetical protein